MTTLSTVTGPVASVRGRTLVHEHIRIGFAGAQLDPRVKLDEELLIQSAADELAALRAQHGVALIVDATPADLCRDTRILRQVSERSGVGIVASTGMYREGAGYPPYWAMQETSDLEDFFTMELRDATEDPDVLCGVIKIATSGAEPTPSETRALQAAARVSRSRGTRVLTHTDPGGWVAGNPGLRQLETLVEGGVHPSSVVIGHACGAVEVDQLSALAERGAYIGFDRVGMTHVRSDEGRADLIVALARLGYCDRILLAHDHQHHWVRMRPHPGAPSRVRSFSLLFEDFLPLLNARGMGPDDVERLLSSNPASFLFGA